ncbi:MAG: hypothetical protein JXM79_08070 [Sedimentisphaerales bacterium]|nr:hypothetical protein [Sedimentisphaerales bacterium]
MSDYPHITYKRHTFLSALVMGLCALLITIILSGTAVVLYSMHFIGDKSEKIVTSLIEDAVQGLPVLQKSLPPVLGDLLNDRRLPDYRDQLDILAKTTVQDEQRGRMRTEIKITNNGDEVVSLLSLRVIILDSREEILDESNQWAATPIAADDDWHGPIMPGSSRRFAVSHYRRSDDLYLEDLKTEVEITDVRVWNGGRDTPLIENTALSLAGDI